MTLFSHHPDPARDQLLDNVIWWAENRSTDQALSLYTAFHRKLASLSSDPGRHPYARENDMMVAEIREFCFCLGCRPAHRAIFQIDSDNVRILAIRHLAQADIKPEDL